MRLRLDTARQPQTRKSMENQGKSMKTILKTKSKGVVDSGTFKACMSCHACQESKFMRGSRATASSAAAISGPESSCFNGVLIYFNMCSLRF